MDFTVHCFDITFTTSAKGYRQINESVFWKNAEQEVPGIKGAKGAYIFALRRSKGFMPFYVGKTNNKFGKEAFHAHKVDIYNTCVNDKHGTPIILFIAARTETGKFSKEDNDRLFQWLETYLINLAIKRNKNLLNISKTSFMTDTHIPSLLNSKKGTDTDDSRTLKRVLSVK